MAKKYMIKLTEGQRAKISEDMDLKVEMLSEEEIEHLATELNKTFDIPFIPEGAEQTILAKLVRKTDRYLYSILPNEVYELIKSSEEGLSEEDAKELLEVLTTRANGRFDLPYLPEAVEQAIFKYLSKVIVKSMRKGYSLLSR